MGITRWLGRKGEQRNLVSIGDPAILDLFGLISDDSGMTVTTNTAVGSTAVYRAVSLIAGTIASLPLRTLRDTGGGTREQVPSVFDNPGQLDDMTRYEWQEFVLVSLLMHGNAYLLHRFNGAGALIGLTPLVPSAVSMDTTTGVKRFRVTLSNGQARDYTTADITHIPALSMDGVRGLSPIAAGRRAIGAGLAGDKAAAKQFKGPMLGGIVTADEDVPEAEAKEIIESLKAKASGTDNAGDIAFVNRKLKFTPWMMSAADAQFIESRNFQVVEIARLYGLPPILLSDTEKTTSWGQGVHEVVRGMSKFTLRPWTARTEQRYSNLLPEGVFVEHDYAGLLQGNQEEVTDNLIKEMDAGLLTRNEARAILNRPPLPEGDTDA